MNKPPQPDIRRILRASLETLCVELADRYRPQYLSVGSTEKGAGFLEGIIKMTARMRSRNFERATFSVYPGDDETAAVVVVDIPTRARKDVTCIIFDDIEAQVRLCLSAVEREVPGLTFEITVARKEGETQNAVH